MISYQDIESSSLHFNSYRGVLGGMYHNLFNQLCADGKLSSFASFTITTLE